MRGGALPSLWSPGQPAGEGFWSAEEGRGGRKRAGRRGRSASQRQALFTAPLQSPASLQGEERRSSCLHSLADDQGQPLCHLGIPANLSLLLTSASGPDTLQRGGQGLVRNQFPVPKALCKEGLTCFPTTARCRPRAAAEPPWTAGGSTFPTHRCCRDKQYYLPGALFSQEGLQPGTANSTGEGAHDPGQGAGPALPTPSPLPLAA